MAEINWDTDEAVVVRLQKPIAVFDYENDITLEFPSDEWERNEGALPTHSVEIQVHCVDALCEALQAAKRRLLAKKAAAAHTQGETS